MCITIASIDVVGLAAVVGVVAALEILGTVSRLREAARPRQKHLLLKRKLEVGGGRLKICTTLSSIASDCHEESAFELDIGWGTQTCCFIH